jgi:hypothetical protein
MLSRFRDIHSAIDLTLPRLGPPDKASTPLALVFYLLSSDCTYHTRRILYIPDGSYLFCSRCCIRLAGTLRI